MTPTRASPRTRSQQKDEIEGLVKDGEVSRALRRLLDFVRDYSREGGRENEAVMLSARYSHLKDCDRRLGASAGSDRLRNEIILGLFGVLEAVDGESSRLDEAPKQARPQGDAEAEDRVFQCDGLCKSYGWVGARFALRDVGIALRLGSITGVVGMNGSGKTTLLRIIAGEIATSGGTLSYPLLDASGLKWDSIRGGIAYVPQDPSPWDGRLADTLHGCAAMSGLRGRANDIEVKFVLHRLGLERHGDLRWNEISGGYKMRFELARALILRPRLLVLDEPLAPLDINAQKLFLQDLRDIARSRSQPLAVIVSSQHIYEVESIADGMLVIEDGRPIFYGPTTSVKDELSASVFELSCDATRGQLDEVLSRLQILRITLSGSQFVIHGHPHTDGQMILRALLEAGIKIDYFRNIGTSTRRLFLGPAEG
jgi:ABC-2 type transport system ATP-binding protein